MSSVCVPQDAEALSHCGPPSATCKKNIDWMRSDGLVNHPDWYPGSGLTPASPTAAMQAWLYHRGGEDCSLPCGDLSALHLGFDPVRPSWLAPDVDSDPHTICNERVLWQPEKFQEAFWSVKSVKVFQPRGTATTCSDGERNGGEDGVDCGGPCDAACPTGGPPPPCHSPLPGEPCYVNVQWVLTVRAHSLCSDLASLRAVVRRLTECVRVAQQDGLIDDADWYKGSGLTPKSDRRAVQAWLHHLGPGQDGSCGLPCGVSDLALPFSPCTPRPNCFGRGEKTERLFGPQTPRESIHRRRHRRQASAMAAPAWWRGWRA